MAEKIPPTPVVFVRVANTGVSGEKSVRVANAGLKVAGFSVSCGLFVRVANTGLTGMFFAQKNEKSAVLGSGTG